MSIHEPRCHLGPRLPKRTQNRDVVSAETAGFSGSTRRILTPRILDFPCQPLGAQNRETILYGATCVIKISENEMFAGSIVPSSRFAVDHDAVGSGAIRVEFHSDLVCSFQYLRVRAVCCRTKWKVVKRSGSGNSAIPKQFHIPQDAREVHGGRVTNLREQDEVVLRLVQVAR